MKIHTSAIKFKEGVHFDVILYMKGDKAMFHLEAGVEDVVDEVALMDSEIDDDLLAGLIKNYCNYGRSELVDMLLGDVKPAELMDGILQTIGAEAETDEWTITVNPSIEGCFGKVPPKSEMEYTVRFSTPLMKFDLSEVNEEKCYLPAEPMGQFVNGYTGDLAAEFSKDDWDSISSEPVPQEPYDDRSDSNQINEDDVPHGAEWKDD
jgi:hypothetical protein